MEFRSGRTLSNNVIAKHWEEMEKAPHEFLIYQLTNEAKNLDLNDWGFALMINETAKEIYPGDDNGCRTCIGKFKFMNNRSIFFFDLPKIMVFHREFHFAFFLGKN